MDVEPAWNTVKTNLHSNSVWRLVGRMKNNAWWTNEMKRVGNEEKMLQNVEKKDTLQMILS